MLRNGETDPPVNPWSENRRIRGEHFWDSFSAVIVFWGLKDFYRKMLGNLVEKNCNFGSFSRRLIFCNFVLEAVFWALFAGIT